MLSVPRRATKLGKYSACMHQDGDHHCEVQAAAGRARSPGGCYLWRAGKAHHQDQDIYVRHVVADQAQGPRARGGAWRGLDHCDAETDAEEAEAAQAAREPDPRLQWQQRQLPHAVASHHAKGNADDLERKPQQRSNGEPERVKQADGHARVTIPVTAPERCCGVALCSAHWPGAACDTARRTAQRGILQALLSRSQGSLSTGWFDGQLSTKIGSGAETLPSSVAYIRGACTGAWAPYKRAVPVLSSTVTLKVSRGPSTAFDRTCAHTRVAAWVPCVAARASQDGLRREQR